MNFHLGIPNNQKWIEIGIESVVNNIWDKPYPTNRVLLFEEFRP